MRRLKQVYPEFEGQVSFYAVGVDPTESLEKLERVRQEREYPWPVAEPASNMIVDFFVLQQSTKVAMDSRGVIVYRAGYSRGDEETWRGVLALLRESAGQ